MFHALLQLVAALVSLASGDVPIPHIPADSPKDEN